MASRGSLLVSGFQPTFFSEGARGTISSVLREIVRPELSGSFRFFQVSSVLLGLIDGRGWTVLDGLGRSWTVLDDSGRCWTVLDGAGRLWATVCPQWWNGSPVGAGDGACGGTGSALDVEQGGVVVGEVFSERGYAVMPSVLREIVRLGVAEMDIFVLVLSVWRGFLGFPSTGSDTSGEVADSRVSRLADRGGHRDSLHRRRYVAQTYTVENGLSRIGGGAGVAQSTCSGGRGRP